MTKSLLRMSLIRFLVMILAWCWSLQSLAVSGEEGQIPGLPQLLQITVVQTSDPGEASQLLAGGASDHTGEHGARRVSGTARSMDEFQPVQLQVLEGEKASIELRYAEPGVQLLWVEEATAAEGPLPVVGMTQDEAVTGMHMRAEVAGERVTLHLHVYRQTTQGMDRKGAAVDQDIETTVAGRLGDWLDLGGILQLYSPVAGSHRYRARHERGDRLRVLARVDRVRATPAAR